MTSPALLSVSSSDNSTIVLHFDRNVFAGDGSIVVSDGYGQTFLSDGGLRTRIVNASDQRALDASDSALTYSGQNITIHLSTPLKNGLNYSITMSGGTVIDDSDDGIARISSPNLFKFTASGSAATVPTPSAVIGSTLHFTDTGTSSSDYITASASQVMTGTYTGTLGASDFVQVSLDNGASWHKATVNASAKTWSYTGEIDLDNLTDGAGDALDGTLLARIGNTSGGSSGTASHTYVYNSHAVEIDVSSSFSFSADTGTSSTDLITKTAAQTISGSYSGSLLAGYTLQVSVDGGANWINASASAGSWHTTGTVNLKSGANEVQARVIDTAGNTSGVASADYKLITSTVSLAGHALTLAEGSDTGPSATDGITRSASKVTLNVAGLHGFHAGDTIQIVDTSHSSAVVGSYVILDADLYYGDDYFTISKFNPTARTTVDINLDTMADGAHTLAARIVDVAGNTAAASGTTAVTVDGKVPLMLSSAPLEDATGVSTGLTKLTFTFNENIAIEDGTIVTITDDNNSANSQEITLSSTAASGNKLTINLSSALTSGTSYTVIGAIVTDLAGNDGVTGDTPLLHFTTEGTYAGGSTPDSVAADYVDTAPAWDTDSGSDAHNDGVTSNTRISVTGAPLTEWHYSVNGTTYLGSGDGFDLEDGTYTAGQIQVWQTVDGVDSAHTSIGKTLVIDTLAPTAVAHGVPESFSSGDSSIEGLVMGTTDVAEEFVEVTFDHGVTWVQAETTYVNADYSTWSLAGISASLGNNYGLRLSDTAGNISTFNALSATNPVYYLADGGVTYSHASDDYTTVFGGSGADTITVGAHALVAGGDGDIITTGANSAIITRASSTVVTGGGTNVVEADSNAHITTGSGTDSITLTSLTGAVLAAGSGTDTLILEFDGSFTLGTALGSSSGIDIIDFGSDGTGHMNILTSASVHNLTDSDQLTVNDSGGGATTMTLESLVWAHTGTSGAYEIYKNTVSGGDGTVVVLIANTIDVTLDTFTA
ncbi:Ig-like domain-containing protein [Duganella sp. CF402]|uniref:beta strand repeat-containing protein n=1 Tax=unclassified Duganella TaxID=2636909 RepID=UPI0008AED3A2|nr:MULTISPECIES: Ig-like domain-containing protein [unclassified Duganella]RZT03800.1 Ig-like protein group 3 [Duganella sp. BK701]SEM59192.1 Ig-like domain-containing protein [Duganella sp. CF402]